MAFIESGLQRKLSPEEVVVAEAEATEIIKICYPF